MDAPKESASTVWTASELQGRLSELKEMRNIVVHALADIELMEGSTKLFYNVDYDLIYPWLWPGAATKSRKYDLVGKNIFSLFLDHHASMGFKICFTVPSILEFLDTIEHRYSDLTRVSESREYSIDLIKQFQDEATRDLREEAEKGSRLKNYLLDLQVGGERTNLRRVSSLFANNILLLAHEHMEVDPTKSSVNKDVRDEFLATFADMERKRSIDDDRSPENKLFHYKVDAWNVAFRKVNAFQKAKEVAFVCRGKIRQYFRSDGSLYSRHPMVLLYQLYGAKRAPLGGEKHDEIKDFLLDASDRMSAVIRRMDPRNTHVPESLSKHFKDQIDRARAEFVHPLLTQDCNGDDAGGVSLKPFRSAEDLRDRARNHADQLKAAAHQVADIAPSIVEDRLLEPYDLSDNPRVREIFRTLNIN